MIASLALGQQQLFKTVQTVITAAASHIKSQSWYGIILIANESTNSPRFLCCELIKQIQYKIFNSGIYGVRLPFFSASDLVIAISLYLWNLISAL